METDQTKEFAIANSANKRTSGEKVHVIACGAIAREILAVSKLNELDHIELTCLPAIWHAHPQKIAPGLEAAIAEARAAGASRIFIGYADCGTGGHLDRVCERHGVKRMDGPHCFAFYQRMEEYRKIADDDMMSFYMTDFLCRQFDAFFMKPLGLDRHPELIADYFGNYDKLIYLAQTDDPELDKVAVAAAKMLGLAYERRPTGYGDLPMGLAHAAGVAGIDE